MLAQDRQHSDQQLPPPAVVECVDLQCLFDALQKGGYTVLGPTVRDGAIVYDKLEGVHDLPIGLTDQQEKGSYRLARRMDRAVFGYTVGPHAWKRFLHPPMQVLMHAKREGRALRMAPASVETPRWAFVGVRACELEAIAIQDRVLMHGPFADAAYTARRKDLLIVAVNCGQAGGTCFCSSTGTGPKVQSGYDLTLTEVIENTRQYFLVDFGTTTGVEILSDVPHRLATAAEVQAAAVVIARTAHSMGRTMDCVGLGDLLKRNYEHPRWQEVSERCLSCGNCTMVCPTCFCTATEDTTDLSGQQGERCRVWDSCFNTAFSYIHGGSVRQSVRSRYRQWLTHKFSTWDAQFGTNGCVGCGRCITWCPAGIDMTEEVSALRAGSGPNRVLGRMAMHIRERRLAKVITQRLQSTRIQLLDGYSTMPPPRAHRE